MLCLGGGELELSKTHLVTGFQVEDVVALSLQQRLEGQDELEVGGGSHIVAPCKSCKIKFSSGRKLEVSSAQRVPEPDPLPGISFDTRPDPIQF